MAKRTSEMPAVFVDRLSVRVGASLEEVERHLLHATLASVGGNQARAAQILGRVKRQPVSPWVRSDDPLGSSERGITRLRRRQAWLAFHHGWRGHCGPRPQRYLLLGQPL